MALEKVLEGFEKYAKIDGIVAEARNPQNENSPEIFDNFLAYVQEYEPGADIQQMQNDEQLQINPLRRNRLMLGERKRAKNSALEIITQEFSEVVRNISNEAILNLAVSLPDKNKKYQKIIAALEQKDIETLRKAYAELSKTPIWKEYVMSMNEHVIENYARTYIQRAQASFLETKGIIVKTKNAEGKEEKKANYDIARNYVTDLVGGMKKKDKQEVYLLLAQTLYQEKAKKD